MVHFRRTVIRLLFRVARLAGADVGDPTLDIVLPTRPARQTRPLTDEEVALGRSSALWTLSDGRRAAAWGLAEATCRTGELAHITVENLDLTDGRVWIHGGRRTMPRWGTLTPWAAVQLERRVEALGGDPHRGVVYDGGDRRDAGRVSTSLTLLDVLRRAGLADEADVRPESIAGWAGRQLLGSTGRIDLVAHGLGLRSLDRTAAFIGWAWQLDGP